MDAARQALDDLVRIPSISADPAREADVQASAAGSAALLVVTPASRCDDRKGYCVRPLTIAGMMR
jgi:hypothetical protein